MAIQLEFLNMIIPIERIEKIYRDGWEGCLRDHTKSIGKTFWYNRNLVRAGGAMDPDMIETLVVKWTKLGFSATEVVDGKVLWKDFAVVDAFGFSRHQCPWLIVDGVERVAWLLGTERGEVVGREQFR